MSRLIWTTTVALAVLLAAVSAVRVTVSGRRLLVDGAPFFMKGVNYSPVPIGQFPGQSDVFANAAIFNRDLPLMSDMGVNLVRLYGIQNNLNSHKAFLDACLARGIRVAMGYWVTYGQDFTNNAARTRMLDEFISMVRTYKSHDAVIMWFFGNEVNIPSLHNVPAFMSLVREATQRAHAEEGVNFRPVSSPLIDIDVVNIVRTYPDAVDVWAAQLYRGRSFFNFFNEYAAVSGKPLFMTEYGIDALDGRSNTELGAVHSDYITSLWSEIVANAAITSGGAVFSWMDEWWKGGDANTQTFHGLPNGGYPDQINNEAWYGLYRVQRNPVANGADVLVARPAVAALRALYRQPSPIAVTPTTTAAPVTTAAPAACGVTTNTLRVTQSPATLSAGSTSVSTTFQFTTPQAATPAGVKLLKMDLFTPGFANFLGSREVEISCQGSTTVTISGLNLTPGSYVISAFIVNRAVFLTNPANAWQSALANAQTQFTVSASSAAPAPVTTSAPVTTRAPAPAPGNSASCSLYTLCAGLAGNCCPTANGVYLACCTNRASVDNSVSTNSLKTVGIVSVVCVVVVGVVATAGVVLRRRRAAAALVDNDGFVGASEMITME